jgi:hypothetical protein
MIPVRFESLLFSFILSVFMSCIASFVTLYSAVGMSESFADLWLSAWAHSWMVGFPILLLVTPSVRLITKKLVVSVETE